MCGKVFVITGRNAKRDLYRIEAVTLGAYWAKLLRVIVKNASPRGSPKD